MLMVAMGVLLLGGLAATARWGGRAYRTWDVPEAEASPGSAARRYLRGVAVVLVAGFWTGVLVTGPALRLAMRLLAATSDDTAQGRLTEADEVVGQIDLGGTIGLVLFGGVLPALLSAAVYVLCRPLLPGGRLGGLAFGALHLVLVATRIDPLRPENPDFELLGPGWLSVLAFGATVVVHGMAVAAFANRYSASLPPADRARRGWGRALAPVALPALFLVPGAPLLVPLVLGLAVAVAVSRLGRVLEGLRHPRLVTGGRVVVAAVTLALLPGTVTDLADVVDRDDGTAAPLHSLRSTDH